MGDSTLNRSSALLFMLLLANGSACVSAPGTVITPRPAVWATEVSSTPGLPNLYRVNAGLYRSAQPGREGFIFLDKQQSLTAGDRPIKTVLSLRASNDDAELDSPDSGLRLEHISFKTWHAEDEDVVKFLRIVNTPAMQPVLVHCKHGSDRTGTMLAIYRIVHDGWSKQQAIDEMIDGGYGFHPIWNNLPRYIQALDVEAIRKEVLRQGAWR
jgi:protein tyrosine/serine phosphatase